MKKNILKQYQDKDQLEVGLDEAGRGCLFGPVCVAGVTWLDEDPEHCIEIRDSKKCTEKHRLKCYDIIIEHSKAYSIQMIDNDAIDKDNILRSSLKGMHLCLDEISKHNMIDKDPDFVKKTLNVILSEPVELRKGRMDIGQIDEKQIISSELSSLVKIDYDVELSVFSESDSEKYDPKNKAKAARPFKPAILIE